MSPKLSDKKLAVLGTGKLGGILLRAYLKQGLFESNRVIATVKHAERAAALAKELGIAVTTDNREAVKGADIVLLTIKPQTVAEVLQEIAPEIGADTMVVSVTGLSASGPAFAYIILESLAEAGVKVGLPRDVATLLAAQMMKGAASVVLETGDHPALLKDAVTTPAGCTIDGILELEEGKLRVTLIKAVVKATSRAGELLFEK
jgi:pyrroline-5-carboxylate reductase